MMKKIITICLLVLGANSYSQIVVTNTQTPAELIQNVLLGSGVNATNIKYNGSLANANSIKSNVTYFNQNSTSFPILDGVLLTSGAGSVAVGPNNQSGATLATGTSVISDQDMNDITPNTPTNGVVLEFDFVATGDSVSFEYIFASEEYPNDYGTTFYDVFGFFLSGPGFAGPYTNGAVNIATLPGSNTAISILNLNPTANVGYYVNNQNGLAYGTSIQFDGTSILLTSGAKLICGETYHIKLGISNVGDQQYDSGVFLKGGSFSANAIHVQATTSTGAPIDSLTLAEGCNSTEILFIRPLSFIDSMQVFHIQTSGDLNQTTDLVGYQDSVIFNIGVDTVSFIINPIDDGLIEPTEMLQIKVYSITACGDTIFDSLRIFVVDEYPLIYDLPDTITTSCSTINPSVAVTNLTNSVGPYTYNWSNSAVTSSTIFTNTGVNFDSTYLVVDVTDGCGNIFPDSVLIINDYQSTEFSPTPNDTIINTCPTNILPVSVTMSSNPAPPYTYSWTSGSVTSTSNLSNNGVNGSQIVYYVTTTNSCGLSTIDSIVVINDFVTSEFSISPNDTIDNTCPTNLNPVTATLVSGNFPPFTYNWSTGGITNSIYATNNGLNGSEVIYYLTTTNACGMSTDDSVVVINDFVTSEFSISPNDTIVSTCPTSIFPVTATLISGNFPPFTYNWSNGGNLATNNVSNNGSDGSELEYQLITTNACGMSTTDSVVVINDFSFPIPTLAPNDTLVVDCLLDSAFTTVNVINGTAPYTYLWSNDSTTNSTYIHDTVGVNDAFYHYFVTVTDACGFDTTVNGVFLVHKTLNSNLSKTDASSCIPDGETHALISGATGIETYQWVGPGPLNLDTVTTLDDLNLSSGWYYFTVTDNVCSDIDSIFVKQKIAPIANLTGLPLISSPPSNVSFINLSENATSYEWDFGNGLTGVSSDLSPQSSNYTVAGYYTIELKAIDGPCYDIATVTIELIDKPQIIIKPNVFSPNNDGENDVFFITTKNVKTMDLVINNRWGNLVFEESGANPTWSGVDCADGVYFYQYTATGYNGDVLEGQGFVHLLQE
jgi:gliding motility-associated-like protein